ncbi:uncharacterized protein LOC8069766 [Sorghum bicolor]|nr:uncharacterized protein LOC8069766 [Sorghum bicolor]|eukprot:XP_002456224.2 uncharacterized protein LOC8069766 [Sorghum bicolor]
MVWPVLHLTTNGSMDRLRFDHGSIQGSQSPFPSPSRRRTGATEAAAMGAMGRLRIFVAQEPVVAASCLIAGFGLFLPAVVRPILDSFETAKQVPPTSSN